MPQIARKMEEKSSRRALFAYRMKETHIEDTFDGKVKANMQSFMAKVDKSTTEPMLSDMGNGFLFMEVKYPDVFVW